VQCSAEQAFGVQCEAALDRLLEEAQVAADWRADPVLEDACEDVVHAACEPKLGGEVQCSAVQCSAFQCRR
jgi:hypothetical protein